MAKKFYRAVDKPGDHDEILGIENIDKVIIIDQSPIGRSQDLILLHTRAFYSNKGIILRITRIKEKEDLRRVDFHLM